jgi:hypothetical protein
MTRPTNGTAVSFTAGGEIDIMRPGRAMVNYILLYKIRKRVKKILKDKIADGELATTRTSCLGCLADDISWEIYYLLKEKDEDGASPAAQP